MPKLTPSALTLTALAFLTGTHAQQSAQRQMTPEMQARMKAMQPVLDLAQTVRLLPTLEKNKTTAMTKAQARALLPLLTALQKASSVQPNDARKYLTQIEDKILTSRQLSTLDDLTLKAEQEREARRTQTQRSSQTGQGARLPGAGLIAGAGRAPGQDQNTQGRPAQGQATQGQPGTFNPFRQARTADDLKAYITLLQKK